VSQVRIEIVLDVPTGKLSIALPAPEQRDLAIKLLAKAIELAADQKATAITPARFVPKIIDPRGGP
jgi:hypothetical protein